jgi:hypothetical protein
MLHFAKLFDFGPLGQLLVQRENSDDLDHEDAPYQLVLKTRNEQGTQVELKPGYYDELDRDQAFHRFDKKMAAAQFEKLQRSLAEISQ